MKYAVVRDQTTFRMHKSRQMGPRASVHHRSFASLFDELTSYQEAGVLILLSGRPVSSRELASLCEKLDGTGFMPDFVLRRDGSLGEIRFDHI